MAIADKPEGTIELRADAVTREVVDVTDGIDRIMGDRELYTRMLLRFRHDYTHGTTPIRLALSAGDDHLAHRLVHTLKGAAGMIGARPLHARASALEQAIRTASGESQCALDALEPELLKVLQVLDILLTGSPAVGAPLAIPTRPLLQDAELLVQLTQLLDDGDGAAVDLLEESAASLTVILGVQRLSEVAAAANEFDFEGALAALRRVGEVGQEKPGGAVRRGA